MKIDFIKKRQDSTRLILIFAGWSAGPEIVQDIDTPGWDVAVVHDFTQLDLDTGFLNEYYTVYLFAWSLGVYAASLVLPSHKITAAIAINGTLTPVHDTKGIPCSIYSGTAENLNPRNLLKFRLRMMKNRDEWNLFKEMFPPVEDERGINSLQRQLYNIFESQKSGRMQNDLNWVRSYISDSDRIFPPDNMKNAWSDMIDTEIISIEGGHFIEIDKIVKSVVPDTIKVARKFSKASKTYNTQAIAQYSIAIKLASLLNEHKDLDCKRLLEIGCGTGLFTREYARFISPQEATFVDIAEVRTFEIFEKEYYFSEDAEQWITRQNDKWDYIVSASCIQWFSNIPRFIEECHKHLNAGGMLVISTFLNGNLKELDEQRPSPLLYPTESELYQWLKPWFGEIIIETDEIEVEFKSHRDMLMHLKHTGVGGSAENAIKKPASLTEVKKLTYKPVYIICRK